MSTWRLRSISFLSFSSAADGPWDQFN
jgi:hypothetical protein